MIPVTTAQPIYVPVNQYQPLFKEIQPVECIYEEIPNDIMGIFEAAQVLSIRQHVKLLPKQCFSCPPCVQQENTFSVYAGLTRDSQAEFLRIDEVSDDWNRCCCAPNHPLKLEVRPYIPAPGAAGSSDWSNLHGDVSRDWQGLTGGRKQQYMREFYQRQPVLFSILRDDGMRCCYKCPCKWLNTFVCFNCCRDGMHIYSGSLPNDPNFEVGRPTKNEPLNKLMGSVTQPIFAGCCTPTMHLRGERQSDADEPYGKIEGPCFFGGCSEFCCDFKFFVSNYKSGSKEGDLALITKKKPTNMATAFAEAFSEADNYTIEFNNNVRLTGAQKATVLAGQLLADYMYFDGNTDKCKIDENGITIYCFYCSIIGYLLPCCIYIPFQKQ